MDDGFNSFYQGVLQKELEGILPAELLARYEVTSCLAHGQHSEIYLVSRREDGALGILRVGKADAWENAQAEYDILRRLDHPGIPKAMDVFAWQGKGFLVREYMPGQTLARYVQTFGPLKQAETIAIAVQICDILTVLHSQKPPIIHRDIKPENIIIDKDGKPKLIDFGIARIYRDKATSDTIAIGTRAYMAPEQFGASQTDARADIFSLGVVLIFLGTQSPERANLRQRYPHKELLPIIQKCLKYDPEKRYGKSIQLKRALLSVQRSRTRRVMLAAGAGVLCLGAAGAGVYFAHQAGYDSGMTDGLSQGMQAGFSQGYTQGEKTGHAAGEQEGYEAGYQAGWAQVELFSPSGQDFSAEQVFAQDAAMLRGNTNGNYANGALAATDGTLIYYGDGSSISKMDMAGKNAQFFCGQPGENLSVYGAYLYFTNSSGIWRAGLADGTVTLLQAGTFERMMVQNDFIYAVDAQDAFLYRMNLEGGDRIRVSDREKAYYLNLQNGWMIFADGLDGNHLTASYLDGGQSAVLDAHDTNWINVVGNTVFYMQYQGGPALYRVPLSGGERTKVADVSATAANVGPLGIFFANGYDGNRLSWIPVEGGDAYRLTEEAVSHISVVGNWVFFRNADMEGALYCIQVQEGDFGAEVETAPAAVQVDL